MKNQAYNPNYCNININPLQGQMRYKGCNLHKDLAKAGAIIAGIAAGGILLFKTCKNYGERLGNVIPMPFGWKEKEQKNPTINVENAGDNSSINVNMTSTETNEVNSTWSGRSSEDLFNSDAKNLSKWIVDGYMKVGQVNLLVAGAGVGKSMFMLPTALAVSQGTRPEYLPLSCQPSVKQNVVYYILEVFEDEFKGKYGEEGNLIKESGIKWVYPKDLSEFTMNGCFSNLNALASCICEDTTVFIDPATRLPDYNHKKFIQGVQAAQMIAKSRGFTMSIVIGAHLDETKPWSPLTTCDIQGGDAAIRDAGSVTAIRPERRGDPYRYLVCLKDPKGSGKPFNGDALVMKIEREDYDDKNWFVRFVHDNIKPMTQALPLKPKAEADIDSTESQAESKEGGKKFPNQKVDAKMLQQILELKKQGLTDSEIADQVNKDIKDKSKKITPITVKRNYEKYLNSQGTEGTSNEENTQSNQIIP